MYRALYREYRPASFSEVVGQDQITQTLKNEIVSGRIAHAYLFTGSRGTGKTSCAKILAKAVNCLSPKNGDPCNECEICRAINSETIMDVVEMDAASNNGVGNVRDLQEELTYTPSRAKYRVYIIDEVHMMSGAAFNALLKTLEEPPPHVIFILATTELHKLPATILSRCQRHDFRRVDANDIAAHLRSVAEREGQSIDEDGAMLIARIADGGMRDALSLLDQCLSVSGSVNEDVVRRAAGLAGSEHIHALADAMRRSDAAELMSLVAAMHSSAKDMSRLCEELIEFYRSLMIIHTVREPEKFIVASRDELEQLTACAGNYTLDEILRILDGLQSALERMSKGASRRTELELALMRLTSSMKTSAPDQSAIDVLAKRVAALEKRIESGAVAQPAANKPAPGSRSVQVPDREANKLSDQAVPFEDWGDVLELLAQRSPGVYRLLEGSRAFQNGPYMLIETTPAGLDMLRRDTMRDTVRTALLERTGLQCKLGPYRPTVHAQAPQEELSGAAMLAELAAQNGIKNTDE